jgi:hypothetical protein
MRWIIRGTMTSIKVTGCIMRNMIRRTLARLILFTPLGQVEWIVNLHYRYVTGQWPPWRAS